MKRVEFPGFVRTACLCLRVALLVGALVGALPLSRVRAATVTLDVDTTIDSGASQYEACTSAPNDCSLRGALDRTYGGGGNEWIVNIPAGTFVLTSGDLDIMTNDLTINGAGRDVTVVDGNDNDRVFEITVGDVIMNDLTIANGHAPDGPLNSSDGGGIRNHVGNLTMNNCAFRDNRAGDDSPSRKGGDGGAIWVDANHTILNNCIFSGNRAGKGPAGNFGGFGGAIYVLNAYVTVNGCTFSDNRAGDGGDESSGDGGRGGYGGAITNLLGTLTVSNTTFSGNRAGNGGDGSGSGGDGGGGGGVYTGGDGHTDIESSTFSGNYGGNGGDGSPNDAGTGGYGGGLASYDGWTTVINSTFSGNHAGEAGNGGTGSWGGYGGGIDNYTSGNLTLVNTTISGNYTGSYRGYGGGVSNFGRLRLRHTIIANNTTSKGGPDCATMAALHSYGYNLIEDTSFCSIDDDGGAGTLTGNIYGQDPQLGPLGDHGGPTLTHKSQAGSPVVDAGDPAGCTGLDGTPVTVDQRGYSRPQDGGTGNSYCDIGAVERQPQRVLSVSVSGFGAVTSDVGSIDCPGVCSDSFVIGSTVTLTITTVSGWTFEGWGGACTGTGSCTVLMDQDQAVTAALSADHHVYLPLVLR